MYGENAGVVDVGDRIAAAIRIESHNHPVTRSLCRWLARGVSPRLVRPRSR